MRASSRSLASIAILTAAIAFLAPHLAQAATPTITSLSLSSSSVTTTTKVTLTAHVTANGAPIHPGTVTFCNANAPHCEDAVKPQNHVSLCNKKRSTLRGSFTQSATIKSREQKEARQ